MIYKIFDNAEQLVCSIESAPKGPSGKYLNHGEFNKDPYIINYPVGFKNKKPVVDDKVKRGILRAFENVAITDKGKIIPPIIDLVNEVVKSKDDKHANIVGKTKNVPFTNNPNIFMKVSKTVEIAFCILKIVDCVATAGAIIRDLANKKEITINFSKVKDIRDGKISLCREH